jgi:wobble nucleotide-excising tRNase
MKKRLNITVNEKLIERMKQYAEQHDTSISHLVEDYFESLVKPKPKLKKDISLVDFVESLPKSKVNFPEDWDWKKEYYKAKAKKYGLEDLF